MLDPGTWWVRSTLDPRWNGSGNAMVGMFVVPVAQAAEWIARCETEYGERPADLETGYMKD